MYLYYLVNGSAYTVYTRKGASYSKVCTSPLTSHSRIYRGNRGNAATDLFPGRRVT